MFWTKDDPIAKPNSLLQETFITPLPHNIVPHGGM